MGGGIKIFKEMIGGRVLKIAVDKVVDQTAMTKLDQIGIDKANDQIAMTKLDQIGIDKAVDQIAMTKLEQIGIDKLSLGLSYSSSIDYIFFQKKIYVMIV